MENLIFSLLSAALIQRLDAAGCYLVVTPSEGHVLGSSYDVHLHNGNGMEINKATFKVSVDPAAMVVSATLIIEEFSETLLSGYI